MKESFQEKRESLTYIYSGMSPIELIDEYDAYVKENDYGIFYNLLMKEISQRSKGETISWIEKMRKYNNFLNKADNLKLNPKNVFQDIGKKGQLLENILGYSRLKGDKRSIKTLVALNDVRIGKAFQDNYITSERQLGRG